MVLLLTFSPFLAFLLGQHLWGPVAALCAGAAAAVALVVRERLRGAREVRVLEVGTAVLFGALALAAAFMNGIAWSVGLVRLVVDCGLMLLVLGGVAAGRPFTLSIARARVTPERAASPAFLRCAPAARWPSRWSCASACAARARCACWRSAPPCCSARWRSRPRS